MQTQPESPLRRRNGFAQLIAARPASLLERWEVALAPSMDALSPDERAAVRQIISRFSQACVGYLEHRSEEILASAAAWLGPSGMIQRFTLAQLQEFVGAFHQAAWPLAALHANGDVSALLEAAETITECSLAAIRSVACEHQRRILNEANETAEFGFTLAEVTRSVTSSLNLDEVLQLVCEEGARLTAVEGTLVRLLEEDGTLVCRAVWGSGLEAARGSVIFTDDTQLLCSRAVRSRRVQTGTTTRDLPLDPNPMARIPGRACLAVPIIAKGEVLGAMLFLGTQNHGPFDLVRDAELVLTAELLVGQIALAIYNARLHAQVRSLVYALDHIGECVLVVDSEGRIVYANQAVMRALDYPPPELVGQSLLVLAFEAAEDGATRRVIRESFMEMREGEVIWRHRSGAPVPFHVVSAPMGGEGSGVSRVVILARDVTEEKRRQEEEKAHRTELQCKNQELEAFVYTVSHDLRSPLVSLHGLTGMLRIEAGDALGENARHLLDRLDANVLRMERLIGDLLQFSRVGRHLQQEVVALDDAMAEIATDWQERLNARGIRLDVAPSLPVVYADRTSLRQVMDNLIGNAAKFMSDNPAPRIEVGGFVEGDAAHLYVRDNGIGIAPEYHERVFVIFQRLHTEADVEGTGVGLAIVRKVIESLGGKVWIESQVGEGCTVHFTLPAREKGG
ncbi:MAG TPA: PAS domain-containing protein [Armatimonadetes bacterium]|jgi:PAS domain S-box-containing protein|nr:PAS domain-containing protein [Armatimonadota bacterium]